MVWAFSNRRRAKEAVTVIRERYGAQGLAVLVTSDMVYVEVENPPPNIDPIMHFGIISQYTSLEDILAQAQVQEVYYGEGTAKFRL